MVHQTFVWWALYILHQFVQSPIRHLGLAIRNVQRVHVRVQPFFAYTAPSPAYMHWWTGSALVQVMAWYLFGAKPLPELRLTYHQLDLQEQISMKFEWKYKIFYPWKYSWKWPPFCPEGDELRQIQHSSWLICVRHFAAHLTTTEWYAPSQWETSLQCNDVSHWLGAYQHNKTWVMCIFLGTYYRPGLICVRHAADLVKLCLQDICNPLACQALSRKWVLVPQIPGPQTGCWHTFAMGTQLGGWQGQKLCVDIPWSFC